jgi:hypothetical protein
MDEGGRSCFAGSYMEACNDAEKSRALFFLTWPYKEPAIADSVRRDLLSLLRVTFDSTLVSECRWSATHGSQNDCY